MTRWTILRREQLGMCSEQQANQDRKREHPAHRHPGDDVIDRCPGSVTRICSDNVEHDQRSGRK